MTSTRLQWFVLGSVAVCGLVALAERFTPATEPSPDVSASAATTSAPAPETARSAATTQSLPTAQQVIDRFIEATGGQAAYESITSRHLEADYEMADLGVSGKLVADIRADGNARQTITIPDHDTFMEGITGNVAWTSSLTGGPRILSGTEAQSLRQSLALAPELSLDAYRSADVTDIFEVNGVPCYKMVLLLKAIESTETRFYDIKTGYLLRREGFVSTSEGPIAIVTRYGDYEDAPPIRIAMKVRQSMSGLSPEQIVTKVQHNTPIPDELFVLPSDVVELQKHRAATQNAR
jgi:hypothetical protein